AVAERDRLEPRRRIVRRIGGVERDPGAAVRRDVAPALPGRARRFELPIARHQRGQTAVARPRIFRLRRRQQDRAAMEAQAEMVMTPARLGGARHSEREQDEKERGASHEAPTPARSKRSARLERDDFSSKRYLAPGF